MDTNAMQYSVEDDLDVEFFEALKQMQEPSHHHNQAQAQHADDTACLITDKPLNAFHVQLECGHKFNYEPLYQEVLRQKGRMGIHNYYEKIGTCQIKCPYCRSITNQLLPYIGNTPHPVIRRLVGVNAPANMCMPGVPCGANKCHANAFYECDNKLYCFRHHQLAIKPKTTKATKATKATKTNETTAKTRCVAENQSGINKGSRCRLNATAGSTMCKIHAKCNAVVAIVS
jgi:hypothetical protein